MARTSITTCFLVVLVVIFVTEMAFGRRLEGEQLPTTGITGSTKNPVANQDGKLNAVLGNVGLNGNTDGSSKLPGGVEQTNGLKGDGNAMDLKGVLEGTGSLKVADVATGSGCLKPQGDLKKGEVEVTGTGTMTVAGVTVTGNLGGEPGCNSQTEKPQTEKPKPYESHYSNGNDEAATQYPPKNY